MESGEKDLLSKQAILSLPRDKEFNLEGKLLAEYINVKDIEALPTVQSQSTADQLNDSAQSTNLIDRQAAIDALDFEIVHMTAYCDGKNEGNPLAQYNKGLEDGKKAIEALPSAQPETAKRIVGKSRNGMTLWYQCDMCNEPVDAQDNYCRGCGRRLIDG